MQERADEAIAEPGRHPLRHPRAGAHASSAASPRPTTGGIYYTGPSEDFTRPGRMWWSVPKGVTEFGTWRELTTVYHEGVPGPSPPGRARRSTAASCSTAGAGSTCWVSGHGEGWALYAERLMDDLGYLDDPGNRIGLLDGQSLRAARVVLDIGVPLRLRGARPRSAAATWTYDKAWQFLSRARQPGRGLPALRARPLPRLAGAGAVVQDRRAALAAAARRGARQREGDAFDLKDFHRRALDLGGVGLDTLRDGRARRARLATGRPDAADRSRLAPPATDFPCKDVAWITALVAIVATVIAVAGLARRFSLPAPLAADSWSGWWRRYLPFVPEVAPVLRGRPGRPAPAAAVRRRDPHLAGGLPANRRADRLACRSGWCIFTALGRRRW